MASTGSDAIPILSLFASAFSPTVFPRVQLLAVACLLATGRLSRNRRIATYPISGKVKLSSYSEPPSVP